MRVAGVTFSGADDMVAVEQLIEFGISTDAYFVSGSGDYPSVSVEFGILLSESRSGSARYPSGIWLAKLQEQRRKAVSAIATFSAHLCGDFCRSLVEHGEDRITDVVFGLNSPFRRVQLNCRTFSRVHFNLPLIIAQHPEVDWIIQTDGDRDRIFKLLVNDGLHHVYPLYDCSGGKGQVPAAWPRTTVPRLAGYAGGLSPNNLLEQLTRISRSVPVGQNIWIDMESGVRNENDEFDLKKCCLCLEQTKAFNSMMARCARWDKRPPLVVNG